MKRHHLYPLLAAGVLASAMISCADGLEPDAAGEGSNAIGFRAEVSEDYISATPTRGGARHESFRLTDNADEDFELYCIPEAIGFGEAISSGTGAYRGETAATTRASLTESAADVADMGIYARAVWGDALIIQNERYQRNTAGVFESAGTTHYWPGDADKRIDFYSYSPCNAAGLDLSAVASGNMKISYAVPEENERQQDLLLDVKKDVAGDYNRSLPITYRHLLTAVRVNVLSLPTGASVTGVSFNGLSYTGTLDMDADSPQWRVDGADRKNFSAEMSGGTALFLMMPQTVTAGSVEMTVTLKEGLNSRTLSARLPASVWGMGEAVAYNISVSDYGLRFTDAERTVDAHYVVYRNTLDATSIPSYVEWELTVSDGASIQWGSDVNKFAQEGYWTDRVVREGQVTAESARGTSSITGWGGASREVYVFVPENATEAEREITFTLTINGESSEQTSLTLLQEAPYGAQKWEQIDDNEQGIFGFSWNRQTVLILPYNTPGSEYSRAEAESLISNLIGQYDAGSYATRGYYTSGFFSRRYYILIDYTMLNDLTTARSATDGHANTIGLLNKVGKGGANTFENALLSTHKTESGKEDEMLFRYPVSSDPASVRNLVQGENNTDSGILDFILKKNRCNLTVIDGGIGSTSSPVFSEEDIVWYLPAYAQFTAITSGIKDPVVPANYWSSTAADNGTQSYIGSGSAALRTATYRVRACRR